MDYIVDYLIQVKKLCPVLLLIAFQLLRCWMVHSLPLNKTHAIRHLIFLCNHVLRALLYYKVIVDDMVFVYAFFQTKRFRTVVKEVIEEAFLLQSLQCNVSYINQLKAGIKTNVASHANGGKQAGVVECTTIPFVVLQNQMLLLGCWLWTK